MGRPGSHFVLIRPALIGLLAYLVPNAIAVVVAANWDVPEIGLVVFLSPFFAGLIIGTTCDAPIVRTVLVIALASAVFFVLQAPLSGRPLDGLMLPFAIGFCTLETVIAAVGAKIGSIGRT